MKKKLKLFLLLLALATTVVTNIECTNCDHVCDEECTYDENYICQHECDYSVDPIIKWEPWG